MIDLLLNDTSQAVIESDPLRIGQIMDDETLDFAVDLFSALAHPTRLRIVELLTAQERTVNEIAVSLEILQPNTSQHLAILQRAGVVKVSPKGAQRFYSIRGPRISRILVLVNEFRNIHADILRIEIEQIESR